MRDEINKLPIITLYGMIMFPGTLIHFDILEETSQEAVKMAMNTDQRVFLSMQKEVDEDGAGNKNHIGIVAEIKHYINLPNKTMRVLIEGVNRAKLIRSLNHESLFHIGEIEILNEEEEETIPANEKKALLRAIKEVYSQYAKEIGSIGKETLDQIISIDNINKIIDEIMLNSPLSIEQKQEILETVDIIKRYEKLLLFITDEIEILRIKKEYQRKVKEQVDKNQKEYLLREQLKLIQEELGNGKEHYIKEYLEEVDRLTASKEVKDTIKEKIEQLKNVSSNQAELANERKYLDLLLSLPWDKKTPESKDLEYAEKVLNEDHYGLEEVKTRITEFLAVRILNKGGNIPIICLVGPPGTGKTSIAKSIARALKKEYVRISLGGVRDEAEIRGHRRTYIGALPGKITNGLKNAKVKNPLFLLDEIDKVGSDYKGDVASALLEVLDAEQNYKFSDHYVEMPVDLSEVLFICTANSLRTIPRPLLDRLEVIEVPSYTENEKMHIAKDFLYKKQLKVNGLTKEQFKISDKAIMQMITGYTKEAGVRNLERHFGKLCRKVAKDIVIGGKDQVRISIRNLEQYLGKEKYTYQLANKKDEIGIVRGLAWTSIGGDTIEIEVNIMPGKGKFDITGQIGNIMRESAQAGISYIRSISSRYQIPSSFFDKQDIHLHIPEGAVPKDGPSAGITMVTAMLSAIIEKKVRADIAMTGEITIRGRVLPIGGLKEKLIAAKTAKISTVILPKENKKDVDEISTEITDGLKIEYVSHVDEVIDHALIMND